MRCLHRGHALTISEHWPQKLWPQTSTIGTRLDPKFLQHTEHASSINYCSLSNGLRSLLQSMADRSFSLVQMDTLHSFYTSRETSQEQATWITDNMKKVICLQLGLEDLLPVTISTGPRKQASPGLDRMVWQIYDASSCSLAGEKKDCGHPHRQLTRLEVMVWATNAHPLHLDGHTRHRLEYRGDYRVWVVLDRPFELTTNNLKPWSSLGFAMSKDTSELLFQESHHLEDLIDSALSLGFELDLGMHAEQALENDQFISRAYERKVRLFGDVDEVDALLGSLTQPDLINLYMKRGLFTAVPNAVDWRPDVEESTLRQYLRKP